ncbi:GRAM-domain-containing protein [Coniophora puteana RWD-64-598 SS2]|uniref:GRAM-domain-containing protein n=1 Tax=Coniophora puteana (strain RWD-64-598) TaxID=741705 RepID=A0A5M3MG85_CONPW|nr:GRAM-domain-containing protein [Coniophora puteana RWD-64-598 SS2]EIW77611.1 GRAM-domain-containing protein [Coniophora puteana RWD-64-598 SS2]
MNAAVSASIGSVSDAGKPSSVGSTGAVTRHIGAIRDDVNVGGEDGSGVHEGVRGAGIGSDDDEEEEEEDEIQDDELPVGFEADDIPVTGFAMSSSRRNADFHKLFPGIPEDDYLIEDYSCALQREILIQGRLYVSENHICFHANIFGLVTDLSIPIYEITSIEKKMTALMIPNAIQIKTRQAQYTFASLLSRDTTYDVIFNIWRLARPQVKEESSAGVDDANSGNRSVAGAGADESNRNLVETIKTSTSQEGTENVKTTADHSGKTQKPISGLPTSESTDSLGSFLNRPAVVTNKNNGQNWGAFFDEAETNDSNQLPMNLPEDYSPQDMQEQRPMTLGVRRVYSQLLERSAKWFSNKSDDVGDLSPDGRVNRVTSTMRRTWTRVMSTWESDTDGQNGAARPDFHRMRPVTRVFATIFPAYARPRIVAARDTNERRRRRDNATADADGSDTDSDSVGSNEGGQRSVADEEQVEVRLTGRNHPVIDAHSNEAEVEESYRPFHYALCCYMCTFSCTRRQTRSRSTRRAENPRPATKPAIVPISDEMKPSQSVSGDTSATFPAGQTDSSPVNTEPVTVDSHTYPPSARAQNRRVTFAKVPRSSKFS